MGSAKSTDPGSRYGTGFADGSGVGTGDAYGHGFIDGSGIGSGAIPDIRVVAPSKLAVDLLTGTGREPSEGDELLGWMRANEDTWRA